MKKHLFAALIATMVLASPLTVFATGEGNTETETQTETETETQTQETTTTEGDTTTVTETSQTDVAESIIANESKPYLALGKDLNEEQLTYVLNEMGIAREDLDNYKVVYITNDQEHKYLDSYIDPAVIGSYSLSCVMVKQNTKGSGIRVTTKNINYCTISMYKNALLTAGVEDADVLVVGPFPISGTAALIGAWQAYEEMSGKELKEDAKTAALAEMITIGEISDEVTDADSDKVEELIEYIKAEVIAKGLTDADDIKDVIKEAQEKFGITLTEDQINALVDVMKQIAKLDIDPKKLLEQAGDLYNKYGDTVLAEAKNALNGIITDEVKQSFWDAVVGFFKTLFESIKNYIAG